MLSDKQLADAFRLMVKAQLFVDVGRRSTYVHDEEGKARSTVFHDTIVHKGDAVAATYEAITEAAAGRGVGIPAPARSHLCEHDCAEGAVGGPRCTGPCAVLGLHPMDDGTTVVTEVDRG
jgi:hypothetical protein